MAMHYLGEQLDIHCGGIDHIPVHHTNEIAQSECACGARFATFWIHGGWLTSDKEKMSKSSGGFLTLDKLIDQGIDPLAYRYMCLTAIYRRELSWSWEAIESASNSYRKLKSGVQRIAEALREESPPESLVPDSPLSVPASELQSMFEQAIYGDLNMPKALAVLHSIFETQNISSPEKKLLLLRIDSVLGLGLEQMFLQEIVVPEEVEALNEQRNKAREEKRWKDADSLRDKIAGYGFVVMDTKNGGQLKAKVK